jgi:hypothetical protein
VAQPALTKAGVSTFELAVAGIRGLTTSTHGRCVDGVRDGDIVSLDGGSTAFDNKNAGTAKTVTLTSATLASAAAGNYSLESVAITEANHHAEGDHGEGR